MPAAKQRQLSALLMTDQRSVATFSSVLRTQVVGSAFEDKQHAILAYDVGPASADRSVLRDFDGVAYTASISEDEITSFHHVLFFAVR